MPAVSLYSMRRDGAGVEVVKRINTERTTPGHQRNELRKVHAMWRECGVERVSRLTAREFAEMVAEEVKVWMSEPTGHKATVQRVRKLRRVRDELMTWLRPRSKRGRARKAYELAGCLALIMSFSYYTKPMWAKRGLVVWFGRGSCLSQS